MRAQLSLMHQLKHGVPYKILLLQLSEKRLCPSPGSSLKFKRLRK